MTPTQADALWAVAYYDFKQRLPLRDVEAGRAHEFADEVVNRARETAPRTGQGPAPDQFPQDHPVKGDLGSIPL